jgi:uncharacterized protein YecT (DUF1311 family)
MKAIFIVSILFIICVGLYGMLNGNHKYGKNNSNYDSNSNTSGTELTEASESEEEIETKNANDTNQTNNEEVAKQEKVSESSESSLVDTQTNSSLKEDVAQIQMAKDEGTTQKSEKDQYIERLNSIITYYDELWSKSDAYSMVDMKELKNQEYTKWDDELNTIYQMIKKKLPEEEFIVIRDKEREWITKRDEQAALAANKYSGGTMEGLEYMAVMTDLTKTRTYELVDIYFEE